jgi:hypothetical protein
LEFSASPASDPAAGAPPPRKVSPDSPRLHRQLPPRIIVPPEHAAAFEPFIDDPFWRLTKGHFYQIAPADGTGLQPFLPRPEQVAVIEAIVQRGITRLLIPKARRLGMSTTLGLIAADSLLFRNTWQGSLVDRNAADASRKLDRIVRIALENLPDWVRDQVKLSKSNDSQITLSVNGSDERSFYAGMNARGGSNDFLWISEWGVIQHEDPKRSSRIRAGALPSARHGITVVETTWAGGQGGDVWELLAPSLTGQADDWTVRFFPWHIDPRNVSTTAVLDRDAESYFAKIAPRLEREKIILTESQRRWWAAERRAQGIFMQRENPTFLDECWSVPVQGAVYAEAIDRARAEGRICAMPVDGSNLVHTSWDLGSPENTVVWYWQIVGREIRVLDCDRGDLGTLTTRVARMLARGFSYGTHFVPHDSEQTERTGLTVVGELRKAGLPNVVTVPRTHSVWVGINQALELFPAIAFRSPQCDAALTALAAYRTRRQGDGALSSDEPVHNWASHSADAFRTMAEAHRAGLVQFKHITAQVGWDEPKAKRRGLKPMRVAMAG